MKRRGAVSGRIKYRTLMESFIHMEVWEIATLGKCGNFFGGGHRAEETNINIA